ncbi:1-deoxy-D-xylulose 5-phosphate reductoisomerase 1 [Babesia ovis]|uniref:1-deoxy-D-xylulose 5-phosphate reductoisomerase, apicoplastic n=1 Tax=Babesia ovis TaxID=5869 RepID=A0A9W5TCS8_BABOV|nr:1-deoxy-D-xylulose 5-phosphate reductoisomerase 1 [Babesia ovis]
MPLKLKESVTVFLSVRKGLETCLLKEIKENTNLNCIKRIHFKRQEVAPIAQEEGSVCKQGLANRSLDLASSRIGSSGADRWLHVAEPEPLPTKTQREPTKETNHKFKTTESCSIRLQSGGLEVKCNREWLIGSVISLRSLESVWLRVGTPFRCHGSEDLIHRVSLLPWGDYLPQIEVEAIPLRVITRHSSVWSRVVIEECLRQGIRLYLARNAGCIGKVQSKPDDFCVSVILNRNTCYIAVQCSSRLSPRQYNYIDKPISIDTNHCIGTSVPFWSISMTKREARLEATRKSESVAAALPKENTAISSHLQRNAQGYTVARANYIEKQQLINGDKYDTADALTAGLLHSSSIFKTLVNKPIRIWNPFCGNGLLAGEIVSLLLELPNFTKEHPPSEYFKDIASGGLFDSYDSVVSKYLGHKRQNLTDVEIIASDTSILNLQQASKKLNDLYEFYKPLFNKDTNNTNQYIEHSTNVKEYCNRLPIPLSLHNAPLGTVAPLVYRSMVIAKIPSMTAAKGGNGIYERIKSYKDFGHIVSSRSDWKAVFVIVRGTAFEFYSGLDWKCIAKVTCSAGHTIRLLKSAKPIKVAVIGSTGSIGTQTLEIIRRINAESDEPKFKVVALSANSNADDLSKQAMEFKPNILNINFGAEALRQNVPNECEITTGKESILEICKNFDYDLLVMGISGCAGIEPTIAAAEGGKSLALANKESVVSAGCLLRKAIKKSKCELIPIDSEHNAIYQCLMSSARDFLEYTKQRDSRPLCGISSNVLNAVKRLIITSSGGPFRDTDPSLMKSLRLKDAIKHPVWSMGAKITIDSSTMMNKGLEVIEAHELFGIPYDSIRVLIHKECIVHSLVQFVDNSVMAQLYNPDMKLPIAYALNWPDRLPNTLPELDLVGQPLSFTNPDLKKFPCLKLAFEVGKMGGLYPTVLNAANEQANELLRQDAIAHWEIHELVKNAIDTFKQPDITEPSIDDIMEADAWGKQHVMELFTNQN